MEEDPRHIDLLLVERAKCLAHLLDRELAPELLRKCRVEDRIVAGQVGVVELQQRLLHEKLERRLGRNGLSRSLLGQDR